MATQIEREVSSARQRRAAGARRSRSLGGCVIVGVAIVGLSAGGCAPRSTVPADARASAAASGSAGGQMLMSARDRERLATLAAQRSRAGATDGYVIGPDDLLDIRIPDLLEPEGAGASLRPGAEGGVLPVVAAAPSFHEGVRVSGSGDVTLPLIGQVRARGLTPHALEREIAHRLVAQGILRAPQVSVSVAEYRSGVVAVVGSVERPGLYPLTRPGATIGDMVWAAGGPNKEAGRLVEFVAAGEGAPNQAEATDLSPVRIDLVELLRARDGRTGIPNPSVRAGDVITVAPAGTVQVEGWVAKPGSYPITRGLTVTGAVAAAGGALFPADRRHATMTRVRDTGEHSMPVDLEAASRGEAPDLAVTDGDVLHVPASPVRVVPWGAYSVVRDLVHVGGVVPIF